MARAFAPGVYVVCAKPLARRFLARPPRLYQHKVGPAHAGFTGDPR